MKGFSSSFFNVPTGRNDFSVGTLLVAEPFMNDKWFGRAVIVIIDNDEKGTAGVVLNNRLTTSLSEVFKDVTAKDVPVFCGGPLGHDRLLMVHTLGDDIVRDARMILPGLWLGGRFEDALNYVNAGYPTDGHLRFIIGYSGWSEGQLSDELNDNTWALATGRVSAKELLTGADDAYWHKVVGEMGDKYRRWRVLPRDIRAN